MLLKKKMKSNEKLRDDRIAKGKDVDEDKAAACQKWLRESLHQNKNSSIVKVSRRRGLLRSLEDVE